MGRRCLPFTFPSNVFNFARPAYCRRNKSKSLSALRDPGLFLFCAPPLAAASWARKKRRIPDAEKVVSFFSCFLRNSPLASHLVPPESLANPHFSHFLPSHPALSRISQLSCLFTYSEALFQPLSYCRAIWITSVPNRLFVSFLPPANRRICSGKRPSTHKKVRRKEPL